MTPWITAAHLAQLKAGLSLTKIPIVVRIRGHNVTVGEVFEQKLPRCSRTDCDQRIPIETIIRSNGLGNPTPLYCSQRCGNLVANRNLNARRRKLTPKKALSNMQKQADLAESRAEEAQRRAELAAARVRLASGTVTGARKRKLEAWIEDEALALAKLAASPRARRPMDRRKTTRADATDRRGRGRA